MVKKVFIGYEDIKKVKPLCVILPKISTYRRDNAETKYVSFLIKNDGFLEKYNELWDKFWKVIKNEFDCEPAYHNKYFKIKIKSHEGKINTNFMTIMCQKNSLNTFAYW